MSTILVGACSEEHLYQEWDADAASEAEFEFVVGKALACIYKSYKCIKFTGSFLLEDQISRPDLALVANDFSHWFVIEVELASHSLDGHVLPQVRAFRYGEPQADCITILSRELKLPRERVSTLLHVVPRSVAVIANKRPLKWEAALASLQVQFLTVLKYISSDGIEAINIDGRLEATKEHLGFGHYSALDKTVRFPKILPLPDGALLIADVKGVESSWTVIRDATSAWITKGAGTPDYPHGCMLQLIRNARGGLMFKQSQINV